MRQSFINGLIQLAAVDERVLLITADLGFNTIEPFVDRFPNRFLNVGAAEQGMVAVATGLAREGYHPYCYSIASFAVGRSWEFLRNGPVAHNLTMGLIGIGPGFDYGVDGHTHHAIEDVGLVRMLPGARILCPADNEAARSFASEPLVENILTYFRLARSGQMCKIPRIGRANGELPSASVMVLGLGDAWPRAQRIRDKLAGRGFAAEAAVVEEIGSSRSEESLEILVKYPAIVAVESHLTRGGLASAIAESLARTEWRGRLLAIGPNDLSTHLLGDSDYLWEQSTPSLEEIQLWCKEALGAP